MPIMNEIEKVSGKQYLVNNEQDVAFKVIADHHSYDCICNF